MSMWTVIVIIVAVVAISRVMRERRLAHRDDYRLDSTGSDARAPAPSIERELDDLRERIKVLERIATEGNSLDARETRRISEEIEALRHKQDN